MNVRVTDSLKGKLIELKLIEQDAHDFYVKASQDPSVKNEKMRNCFGYIAEDEQRHIELVDRIISTLKDCL